MKLWRWQKGRQEGTEYKKLCLWSFKIWKWGFDCYILKYKPDTFLPIHRDPVKNGNHYRLNIPLKGKSTFWYWVNWQIKVVEGPAFFRPDWSDHCMSTYNKPVTKLSFGFVKFK